MYMYVKWRDVGLPLLKYYTRVLYHVPCVYCVWSTTCSLVSHIPLSRPYLISLSLCTRAQKPYVQTHNHALLSTLTCPSPSNCTRRTEARPLIGPYTRSPRRLAAHTRHRFPCMCDGLGFISQACVFICVLCAVCCVLCAVWMYATCRYVIVWCVVSYLPQ